MQETPSLSWRDNAGRQARLAAVAAESGKRDYSRPLLSEPDVK
jgi:hypothetical protein